MAVLRILEYPEKTLGEPSSKVESIDESIHTLIKDMVETVLDAPGVGLAAPQVGQNKRVIVYENRTEENETARSSKDFRALINPEIVSASGSQISDDEGCLSVPEFKANVNRYAAVTVRGLNPEGKKVEFNVQGILAVIMQHEIDHLDGILFIDRLSALKRGMYKKKVKKRVARNEKKI